MITIIGDVHGKLSEYRKLTEKYKYTVQVGDMGFRYEQLNEVDPDFHRFFGGNHENYDHYPTMRHSLGEFGAFELNGVKFFFVRGAFSIDVGFRLPGIDWWPQEELTIPQCGKCLNLYQQIKPDLVLTHDAPLAITEMIGNPKVLEMFGFDPDTFSTNTQTLLQCMLESHQPSKWFFGHHHKSIQIKYKGVEFQCLNELETADVG